MTVLVTGGCGFIGTNLVERLRQRALPVRILDDLSAGPRPVEAPGVEFLQGDIRDAARVAEALRGVDAVVHLAASTGVPDSVRDPATDFDVNVVGTLRLLTASVACGVRAFVFASSNAAVGEAAPPVDETKVPRPISPYGAAKLAGEGYCSAFAAAYGLRAVALRFSNVYGPHSSHKTSVVARFIREGLATGTITVDGDGRQTRDFIHVADLCEAVGLALEAEGAAGEVFQIASGAETGILDLAEKIRGALGTDIRIVFAPPRPGDIHRNVSRIAKAAGVLGFRPKVSLEEGLSSTCRWFAGRAG